MDSEEAATVFVEICTRLDALVESQLRTNELLAALESALKEHLEALADDHGDTIGAPQPQRRQGNLQRGLGHFMPYGDNGAPASVASALWAGRNREQSRSPR
jgi:hypothetical protein